MSNLRWLLPGFLSVFVLGAAPAKASVPDWRFDRDRQQLDFSTDQEVQPRVQLIANPTRLVIDLPGIVLGQPTISQSVGTAVQEVRIGQFDPSTTRIVVALAPGYTIDSSQVRVRGDSPTRWHIQLPTPQAMTSPQADIDAVNIPTPPAPSSLQAGTLFAGVVPLAAPMSDLQPQIQALMNRYNFLQSGMFFLDLDTGNYLNLGGDRVFPAASTIKLPILVAFFQEVDAGRVRLDETLTMRRDLVTGGSGSMQDRPVGSRFSALETVTKMITISDNTATNMIIDRLGGIDRLNQRFRTWGLQNTTMHRLLADLRGTNTTSSQDMVRVLALLVNTPLLSSQSRDQVLGILHRTSIRTLLPAGLGAGADIANKTGDIGFLIGDAGVITTASGKRYLAGIFVRRPYDDVRGRNFIQQVSRLVYNYLNAPSVSYRRPN